MSVCLAQVAQDWCYAKSITAASSTGNSDKARRTDLARWGRTFKEILNIEIPSAGAPGNTSHGPADEIQLDIETDLDGLKTSDLNSDLLLRAIEIHKLNYSPATLQRQLSTLRGLAKWTLSKGLIESNPFEQDVLQVRIHGEQSVRAFTPDDVESMIEAAQQPSKRARSAWPTRDAAIIDFIASTGTRNGETCALRIGDIAGADRPILHIQRATKSGKTREVPIPRRVMKRIEIYLDERRERNLPTDGRQNLWIRNDGRDMSTDALYHLVKRLAHSAGAHLPDDALVHGLRHHFGLQLAMRALPPATLQQLMGHADPRTTAIYTRHASFDLVNALDDAGWLE